MRAIDKMGWRFAFVDTDDAFRVAIFALVGPMPENHTEHREGNEQAERDHDGIGLEP